MTTTSLTGLSTSALYAANAQLLTTANNIANAATPGYSRQSTELATAGSASEGTGPAASPESISRRRHRLPR